MPAKKTLTFLLLSISALCVFAQEPLMPMDPLLIRLRAKVISAADSTGIPYANIVNNRTHSGTITNGEGFFTLEMLKPTPLLSFALLICNINIIYPNFPFSATLTCYFLTL